jgi:capsular exopolysaccharide synthesis family protein
VNGLEEEGVMQPSDSSNNLPQPATAPAEVILTSPRALATVNSLTAAKAALLSPGVPNADGLLKAFRQRWLLALTVGLLLGGAAGFAMWEIKPPQYVAFATLQVSPTEHHLLTPEHLVVATQGVEAYQRTQAALVKSPRVLNKALDPKTPAGEKIRKLSIVRGQPDPVAWLEEDLKSGFLEGTHLLRISLAGDEAEGLADVVNAVKNAYLEVVANHQETERQKQIDDLESAYKKAQDSLKEKRKLLKDLTDNLPASDSTEAAHMQRLELDKLAALYSRQAKIESDLDDALVHIASKGKALENVKVSPEMVEERLEQHHALRELLKKVQEKEKVVESYRAISRRGIPEDVQKPLDEARASLEARKKELRPQIAAMMRVELQAKTDPELAQMRDRVTVLRRQLKSITDKIEIQDNRVKNIGTSSISQELQREEIKDGDALLKLVRERKERLAMEKNSSTKRISEQHEALKPTTKNIRSALTRTLALGAVFFFLGAAGVAYREYRVGRVGGREDVSTGLELPVFGVLPSLSGAHRGWGFGSRGADPRTVGLLLRENIDAIRTALLRHEATEARRVFMVTSPGSQEGKTTLSVHLATSIARAHHKTLLVDGDLRCPAIDRVFELSATPGLSQLLKGEADLAVAIQPTTVEGLSVLSAGGAGDAGISALSHQAIGELFAQLRRQFDYIIIDSSPVLPVVDALLLGLHTDGVILSVRPRVSQLPRIRDGVERLLSARIPILGSVINGVTSSLYSSKYHYLEPRRQLAGQG